MLSDRPPAFFVAEHPALDFLNTAATPRGVLVDWLVDGKDLVDWLEQAGLIEPATAARVRGIKGAAVDEVAREAREFRRWLRGFVTARMGKPLRDSAEALGPLNELLARDRSVPRVEIAGRGAEEGRRWVLRRVRSWESPAELLQPIAEAAADLICNQDFRLIRPCEGSACTLLFLDRTKARTRRWCSMSVCGNRAKAAAFRARKSAE